MTAWLDMSLFPAGDPDTVLTADETLLLQELLTQPVPDVPGEVWRRMLDVTWIAAAEDQTGIEGDADLDDPATPAHLGIDGGAGPGNGDLTPDWDVSNTTSVFLDQDLSQDSQADVGDDAW